MVKITVKKTNNKGSFELFNFLTFKYFFTIKVINLSLDTLYTISNNIHNFFKREFKIVICFW